MHTNYFQEDGYCRENTLFTTLQFLNSHMDIKKILEADNIFKMISIFKKEGFEIRIFIPFWYLISPIMLKVFLKNIHVSTCVRRKFKNQNLSFDNTKKAIIYYVSAYDFYRINELWTHYLVELFDNERRSFYDSFFIQYRDQATYPQLQAFSYPPENKMLDLGVIKILIWRNA